MAKTITGKNGGRYYVIPNLKENENTKLYPSVTTILGAMTDSSGLDAWRKRIGEEEADRISTFSANRGTIMHTFNENYLDNLHLPQKDRIVKVLQKTDAWAIAEGFTKAEIAVGRNLFYNFYHTGTFNRIKDVVIQEQMLYSHLGGGYAGRVDLIVRNNKDELMIVDFKTSKKPKREDWIENYKMQISAYFLAYWQMHGEKPTSCEIWISNEADDVPQIFTLNHEKLKEYTQKFLSLVKQYHQRFGKEIEQYEVNI